MGIVVSVTEAFVFLAGKPTSSLSLGDLIQLMKNFKDRRSEISTKASIAREESRKALVHKPLQPQPVPGANQPKLNLPPQISSRRMVTLRRLQTQRGSAISIQKSPRGLSEIAAREEREILLACQKSKKFYEDSSFPATLASIWPKANPQDINAKKVADEWRRPRETSTDPQLFVDDINQGDVVQGALGDCWFISALAVLAQFGPELLRGLFVSCHPAEGLYPREFSCSVFQLLIRP